MNGWNGLTRWFFQQQVMSQEPGRASAFSFVDNPVLAVIDVQEKLMPAMAGGESAAQRVSMLVEGFGLLGRPVIATEQYPQGLGATLPQVKTFLNPEKIWAKKSFSAFGVPEFESALKPYRTLVVCGVETHVCVQMTVLEALKRGYGVTVAADAVGSRRNPERDWALALMREAGAVVTSAESILFALAQSAEHPSFKPLSKLIKSL